jgi:starvation-inducible DNA-binding protein
MNEALVKAAKIGFASQYTFFLKAQFYHWNVEGIHFQELHALFERIYTEVYESIDDFAEKIRACGGYAPSSNTRFNMLSVIDDATEVTPPEAMVAELLQDADRMVTIIKRVYDIAEAEGEHGFSNFLAERMDAFRKHAWMLRATAK